MTFQLDQFSKIKQLIYLFIYYIILLPFTNKFYNQPLDFLSSANYLKTPNKIKLPPIIPFKLSILLKIT